MRWTIGKRIFLALTATSLVIVSLNAAITRWSFSRGFLDYVAEQELATIRDTANELAEVYRSDGDWDKLQRDPRRWHAVLRTSTGPPEPRGRRPPPPPPGRGPPGGPPPGVDPLEFGRRISVMDADQNVIVGPKPGDGVVRTVPIVVAGETVGFVGIAPLRRLTDRIDQDFAREQERSIWLTAVASLLLAALISAALARQLTRPIRSLAAGARSITAGDYDTRIVASRDDELGDLAGEVNQLAATLEANRQSRRRWVADIAHELRTPLAVLRGELDAIEDGVRRFDDATRRSLQSEVARLGKLVNELHELSVYDEGGQSYAHERVDVADLLRDFVAGTTSRLHNAEITLQTNLPDTPIDILADAGKLERVFVNLIENTLRYTDRPGTLEISARTSDGCVLVEFSDSPPSVASADLPRLFDRLYRADQSRSRASGGSGLGLAICKAIVEGHGGTIAADTSKHGGICIRISLPIATATDHSI
ncbi:MAG: ATP-binding protein [Pseudomonadota bacterium]